MIVLQRSDTGGCPGILRTLMLIPAVMAICGLHASAAETETTSAVSTVAEEETTDTESTAAGDTYGLNAEEIEALVSFETPSSVTYASDEEEDAAFLAAINFNAAVYTDAETGITYTQTLSGDTVPVTGASYESALAAGDKEEYIAILKAQTTSFYWDSSCLTEYGGVNKGPAGTETWYNLNMSTIVSVLRSNGYEGEYWVRSDGVKMFGLYILCAADYSTYSYGTIVETSLGTGIIADTGCARGVIDIAVAW